MATGKGNTFINDYLKLLLNGTTITGIAVNDTGTPLTNLFLSLHTGTLSATSLQNTTEAAYTGYDRVAVARTTGGFTAASAQSSALVATASFNPATAGSETETYAMLGTDSGGGSPGSSPGKNLYWGAISPTLAVSAGVTPQLTTATTISET